MAYDALIQGLLGAVMGGAASGVHSIDEEEKARRIREERDAKMKDELTLNEKKLEQEATRKRIEAELERQRTGKVVSDVESAMPGGKPAWSSSTKQGDAIDAGETSQVPMSEADKSRFRITEYGKKGERGLMKEEMDKLEKERRFAADEAKNVNDAERNRLTAAGIEERARHNAEMENIGIRRFEAAAARIGKGEGTAKDSSRIREAIWVAENEFGADPSKKDSPEYKAALAKASARIFSEKNDGSYTTVSSEGYDDNGNRVTTTRREPGAKSKPSEPVAHPKSREEYEKLPSGALYEKNGKTYRKP